MDNILEVRGLKMHFGGVKAVDELMLLGPRVTWADNGNVDSFVSSVIRVDENGDFVPFGDVDTTGLS